MKNVCYFPRALALNLIDFLKVFISLSILILSLLFWENHPDFSGKLKMTSNNKFRVSQINFFNYVSASDIPSKIRISYWTFRCLSHFLVKLEKLLEEVLHFAKDF